MFAGDGESIATGRDLDNALIEVMRSGTQVAPQAWPSTLYGWRLSERYTRCARCGDRRSGPMHIAQGKRADLANLCPGPYRLEMVNEYRNDQGSVLARVVSL